MKNFNWGGRELPFGKRCVRPLADEQVNMLSRSKFGTVASYPERSGRPIDKNRGVISLFCICVDLSIPLRSNRGDVLIGLRLPFRYIGTSLAMSQRLSRYKIGTSSAIIIIFCVLFSAITALPAFGQEADGLHEENIPKEKVKEIVLKDEDGQVIRKVTYNYSLYDHVIVKKGFVKTIYDRDPDADYKKFPLSTYEIDKEKLPKIKVGDKIPDEIMDLPLWVVNNELGSDTITLRQMSAKQWMVLDVWDEYCTPCIKSMNHWEHFLKTHSDKLNFLGLYISFYPHRVPIVTRNRGYLSTQVISSSSSILAKSFLGDGSCLGPNIWIKDGVLFGIANANSLSDEEYLSILSGKLSEIPAHARFNQYWNQL